MLRKPCRRKERYSGRASYRPWALGQDWLGKGGPTAAKTPAGPWGEHWGGQGQARRRQLGACVL